MTGFIIDIILVVAAFFIIRAGWKNGVIKSILSFATTIVAAIVAYAFTPKLSAYFYNNWMLQKVSGGIEKTVGSLAKSGDGYDFPKLISDMPEVFSNMLEKYSVKSDSLQNFTDNLKDTGDAALKKVSDFIASPVSTIISNVLAFIIIFLGALIVLKIVSRLILLLFKAPVLNGADKFAGLILGCFNALVMLWVLSKVLSFGVGALGSVAPSWFGEEAVRRSAVMRIFASYNPFTILENVINYVS